MKIQAIRLDQVGLFAAPIAVEAMSGRLDVLLGPNELGKSTIFRALRAVFSEKFDTRSRAGDVETLKPQRGGNPLIECDFEIGGNRWRLRKQFGSGRFAELRVRGSDKTSWRNAEAEARLSELVRDHEQRLGLLWVDQGSSFDEPRPSRSAVALLEGLIENEMSAAVDGPLVRRISDAIARALNPLITDKTGKPRVGGSYDLALKEGERLTAELSRARATAMSAMARLDEIGHVDDRLAQLTAHEATRSTAHGLAQLRAGVEEARKAQSRLNEAKARRAQAAAQAELAISKLRNFDALAAEATDLDRYLTDAIGRHEALREELATAERDAAHDKGQTVELERQVAHYRRSLAAIERRERDDRRRERLDTEQRRLDLANNIEQERATLTARHGSGRVTADLLAKIEAEDRNRSMIELKLLAQSPVVRIDYLRDAKGRIRVDGQDLVDGAEVKPVGPLELEIDGIGRITITPSGHIGGSEQADRSREQLGALLAIAGVADVATARTSAEALRHVNDQLRAATARLDDLVPEGVPALAATVEKLAGSEFAIIEPIAIDLPRVSIEAELAALLEQSAEHQFAQQAKTARREQILKASTAFEAEQKHRVFRRDELATQLPPLALRATVRADLASHADRTEAHARDSVRDVAALGEQRPGEMSLAELSDALSTAERRVAEFEAETRTLEIKRAKLDGELQRDAQDDVAISVDRIMGEHSQAEVEARRLRLEVQALVLLRETLDKTAAEQRTKILEPAIARISPYLAQLFPDAAMELADGFSLARLERSGITEKIGDLSRGTREQLSVLARLGFARLLADGGREAPLVLDDAMVFSDDQRLDRMFSALTLAAASHQVIVLGCHEASLAPLVARHGGHLLRLTPWHSGKSGGHAD